MSLFVNHQERLSTKALANHFTGVQTAKFHLSEMNPQNLNPRLANLPISSSLAQDGPTLSMINSLENSLCWGSCVLSTGHNAFHKKRQIARE